VNDTGELVACKPYVGHIESLGHLHQLECKLGIDLIHLYSHYLYHTTNPDGMRQQYRATDVQRAWALLMCVKRVGAYSKVPSL
jgi:hypothetical protein